MSVSKIGVLGAGQMGSGIAQVSLMNGLQVVLTDVSDTVLARSRAGIGKGLDILVRKEKITAQEKERAISGLQTTTDLAAFASCDLVVEAATEREELKLSLFRKLDETVPAGRILATNTSSISVTKIAAATRAGFHASTRKVPAAVAIPLPPEKRSHTGKTCPTTCCMSS